MMSLFPEKVNEEKPFDRQEVINEIITRLPDEAPDWFMLTSPELDNNCIFLSRKVNIKEEITNHENKFHLFTKIIESTYNIVVVFYIIEPDQELASANCKYGHIASISSACSLFRILRRLENKENM